MRRMLAPLGVWVLLAVLAITNGIFREIVILARVDETTGHRLSTAILVVLILLVSYLFFTQTGFSYDRPALLAIGVGWAVLTVGFEFLVGYVEGTPVSVTIGQYDVLAGEVWILVPLTLVLAPLVFGGELFQ